MKTINIFIDKNNEVVENKFSNVFSAATPKCLKSVVEKGSYYSSTENYLKSVEEYQKALCAATALPFNPDALKKAYYKNLYGDEYAKYIKNTN